LFLNVCGAQYRSRWLSVPLRHLDWSSSSAPRLNSAKFLTAAGKTATVTVNRIASTFGWPSRIVNRIMIRFIAGSKR
jgi:hypothetical protein